MTTATLDSIDLQFTHGASAMPSGLDLSGEIGRQIADRLDGLSRLDHGWDGADANPPDRSALAVAATVIDQAARAGLPAPELFAVPDGGVQIEWHAGPVELELEIEPGGRGVVFVCDDEQVGQRIDGEMPADASRFALALARLNAYA